MTEVVVDGSGLSRPWAGVGSYTREILAAMAASRPSSRIRVSDHRRVPFAGRHLLWPLSLRRSGAEAYFGPAGSLPIAGTGLPSVVTAHDMAIYRHPEWFPDRQWLSLKVIVPRSMRRATAVIAVSNSTARDLADLFDLGPDRVTVVHEGVAARFRPLEPGRIPAERERLGLPERFILFVGTIEPRKNLATLLDAWERMRDRPTLVVAGAPGWKADEIRARLQGLSPDVRLMGSLDPAGLPVLYSLATALAHPAWYEGFGLTPLEAMACGTPVVVSDASSLPEVVGDAGLLVGPGDVEGWTAALQRVCDDEALRSRLREAGLRRPESSRGRGRPRPPGRCSSELAC